MNKLNNAAATLHGYLLPEEGREQMEQLRNQLFLMASVVFASTLEEEQELLQIRRSMLGQLLESYGLRIDEVLTLLQWVGGCLPKPIEKC